MNTIRTVIVVMCLSASGTCLAAEQAELDAAKQTARDTCMAEAIKRYGQAEIASGPKKKRIGGVKSYAFGMKVGERGKSVNCAADRRGETTFYSGSLT